MRFDPKAEVICDECGDSAEWEAIYVFTSMSGAFGYYDFSDSAFEKWAEKEEWTLDGEKTYCPDCSERKANGR